MFWDGKVPRGCGGLLLVPGSVLVPDYAIGVGGLYWLVGACGRAFESCC